MSVARRVVDGSGIDVPARLPGGVWGAPGFIQFVQFDGNGLPSVGSPGGPLAPLTAERPVQPGASVCRAEVAWPQRWVAQFGLRASQALPQTLVSPLRLVYRVSLGIESASVDYDFSIDWDGREALLLPADLGTAVASFVAQRIQIAPLRWLQATPEPGAAGLARTLVFSPLLGLDIAPTGVRP